MEHREGVGEKRVWEARGCGKREGVGGERVWEDRGCGRQKGMGDKRVGEVGGEGGGWGELSHSLLSQTVVLRIVVPFSEFVNFLL